MNNIIKSGEHNCDVCNVFLKTKHNLNKHYESKKHKQKSIISTQETPTQETPRNTRDHKKSTETERSVTRFFENNVGKIITLNGRECKIISMLKKGKNDKNDTAFSVEDVINKNVLNIGIQTKQDNAPYVENWMNIEKFIHKINKQNGYTEKEKTDAIDELYQLENSVFNTLYKYKDMLKKYRKTHLNAKFVKFAMSVAVNPNTIPTPIKSKLLKMLFITGGVDNKSDEFYYISKKHNEPFEITNLKKVDDEFITNKNLYFYTRRIYTSSGKTQNNMCDYFSFKGSINGKTFSLDFKNLINT